MKSFHFKGKRLILIQRIIHSLPILTRSNVSNFFVSSFGGYWFCVWALWGGGGGVLGSVECTDPVTERVPIFTDIQKESKIVSVWTIFYVMLNLCALSAMVGRKVRVNFFWIIIFYYLFVKHWFPFITHIQVISSIIRWRRLSASK